jgi:membrane-bound ClpP family serine protease
VAEAFMYGFGIIMGIGFALLVLSGVAWIFLGVIDSLE